MKSGKYYRIFPWDFFGYAKKEGFFGYINSEIGIFLGIKYEPMTASPPENM